MVDLLSKIVEKITRRTHTQTSVYLCVCVWENHCWLDSPKRKLPLAYIKGPLAFGAEAHLSLSLFSFVFAFLCCVPLVSSCVKSMSRDVLPRASLNTVHDVQRIRRRSQKKINKKQEFLLVPLKNTIE